LNVSETFTSDIPASQDLFKRRKFAERVAQTLARRTDPASLVVAIHGKWGEGKTTVLNFIYEELEKEGIFASVVPVKFNPWSFRDEAELLEGYFKTVADALGQSPKTKSKQLGEAIRKLGPIFKTRVEHAGTSVEIDAVSKVGDLLAETSPEAQKKYFGDMLVKEGRRVVLFVDDMDRLDCQEIQAVVKLIKLTADFDNVDYVLAYDRNIVAEAIAEKYGMRGSRAGHEYLQKLVQVSLELPVADQAALAKICREGVLDALQNAEIKLSPEQEVEFQVAFEQSILPALNTPRIAKQYPNAATFRLPLLTGEVNPIDVLLLEAVKCLYPELYQGIRDFPSDFTGEMNPEEVLSQISGREYLGVRQQRVAARFQAVDPANTGQPRRLTSRIFPQLNDLLLKAEYGDLPDNVNLEQRVCSHSYLQRYLSCSVPDGDLSDRRVSALMASRDEADYAGLLESMSGDRQLLLFQKLRHRIPSMSDETIQWLILAIARNGSPLRHEPPFGDRWVSASLLVQDLVRKISQDASRFDLAQQAIAEADPLPFALTCLFRLRFNPPEDRTRLFPESGESQLDQEFATRIASVAETSGLPEDEIQDWVRLMFAWKRGSGAAPVRDYIRQVLTQRPSFAGPLLQRFSAWIRTTVNGLDQKSYDEICEIANPEDVISALRQGGLLDRPEDPAAKYAEQFAHIHQSAHPPASAVTTPA
jgi:hypothetical protein